jgi:hypothetical protein
MKEKLFFILTVVCLILAIWNKNWSAACGWGFASICELELISLRS